ncbi:MAG TPA: chorismate lyase [Oxalicibacterium sp.]|nr:chorismate lyase [Oxalicibacterium sp.]
MESGAISQAHWFSHVNGVHASRRMQDWLTDSMSLTLKLTSRCRNFRVQRLVQQRALPLHDEYAQVALSRRVMVQQREVFLRCDDRPMVYAHTIVPLSATASDWPFFGTLGERSLGTTLFGDPQVRRGRLEYARLSTRHPLVRRAAAALGEELRGPLFARRCLYRRHAGLLLVTEVFLPAIDAVGRR